METDDSETEKVVKKKKSVPTEVSESKTEQKKGKKSKKELMLKTILKLNQNQKQWKLNTQKQRK